MKDAIDSLNCTMQLIQFSKCLKVMFRGHIPQTTLFICDDALFSFITLVTWEFTPTPWKIEVHYFCYWTLLEENLI